MNDGIHKIPLGEIEYSVNQEKYLSLPVQFIKELSFSDNQLVLLDSISKWTYKILNVERVSIAILLPGRKHFMVYAMTGNNAIPKELPILVENTCLEVAIASEAICIVDDETKLSTMEDSRLLCEAGIKSHINVPFYVDGTVFGTINIGSSKVAAFSKDDACRLYAFSIFLAQYFKTIEDKMKMEEKTRVEKRLIAQNAQNSRLAALGEMAGGIAHEINNPLFVVRANCQKLIKGLQTGDTSNRELIEMGMNAINYTDRISKTISGMMTLYSGDSLFEIQNENLLKLIEEVSTNWAENFIEEGIRCFIEVDPSLEVNCNRLALEQVLVNLINNAFYEIKKSSRAKDRWIRISSIISGGTIFLMIQDSGPGIKENVKVKIFDPFFTTKPVGHGIGMGLSLSKSLMEKQKGDLSLGDNSKNTTFVLKFLS